MNKKPLIGKYLAVGIVILFLTIVITPGIFANKDYTQTKNDFEITSNDFQFVGIDGITEEYIGPAPFGWDWVINLKIRNNGDTITDYYDIDVYGEMRRITRPSHIVGFIGYCRGWYTPWYHGEIKGIEAFNYPSLPSLLPGIYHVNLTIDERPPWNTKTTVIDGYCFMFWNFVYFFSV